MESRVGIDSSENPNCTIYTYDSKDVRVSAEKEQVKDPKVGETGGVVADETCCFSIGETGFVSVGCREGLKRRDKVINKSRGVSRMGEARVGSQMTKYTFESKFLPQTCLSRYIKSIYKRASPCTGPIWKYLF